MISTLTDSALLIPALALTALAITMKADAATNKTLFDFQAATHSPAWEVVNDDVMGGVSTSQFQVLTNGCAVFSGTVRLENNGGFASVRSATVRENLAGLTTFVLRVQAYNVKSPEKLVLRPKQEHLLRLLRDHGSMSPAGIWEALAVSRQGAMDLLRPLLEAGLVEKIGGKKTGRYALKQP